MEDGLLSLKWNNHRSTFFHILTTLREKGNYTDATLACEGEFFPVHKLVMSTCSDYFADMFERTQCKSPIVVLKDIKKSDLGALLDYMYVGEVDVRQSDLANLIKAAECLRIKGLAVPDEDPAKPPPSKKSVPEPRRPNLSPPPSSKRQRTSGGSSSISPPPARRRSVDRDTNGEGGRANQVPSRSVAPPVIKGGVGEPKSPSQDDDILPIDHIKVERDEDNNSSAQLDHRGSNSNLDGDSTSGMGKGSGDNSMDFNYALQEVEKQEHDQMDYPDQMAGPSGMQDGSELDWGEDDGSFPQGLLGNDDPNQQDVSVNPKKEDFWQPHLSFPNVKPKEEDFWQPQVILTEEEYFKCPRCAFKTKSKQTLDNHQRVHTGERPFKCDMCPYSAAHKANLIDHVRTHTGEKPYKCEDCDYSATTLSTYKVHRRTHTGEKPYPCHMCPKGFSRKPRLINHIFKMHGGLMPGIPPPSYPAFLTNAAPPAPDEITGAIENPTTSQ